MRIAVALLALLPVVAGDEIEEGRKLIGGPEHGKAEAKIRAGIARLEKEPATAHKLHRIGLGRFYLGEDEQAQAAFRGAAELDPKNPEHVYMLGVVQMYSDVAAATATMRRAIELGPLDARFRFELGRLLRRQGRPEEALASLVEACRLDGAHAEAHQQAATVLLELGKPEQAVAHLRLAVEADPNYTDAWYNLGQVAYDRGRFEDALEAWTRTAELDPEDFQTRTKVVQALYALGRYDDAEPHRKRVLELRPKDRKEFCFDQFDAGGNRVYAYETFDKTGDLYYHFTFKVLDAKGGILRTVNLESSAVIREMGAMYVLGANLPGGEHRNYGIHWKEMPPYGKLKELVAKAAKGELDRN